MTILAHIVTVIVIATGLDMFAASTSATVAQGDSPASVNSNATQESRAKQMAERSVQWAASLPLVAKPMSAADVEALFDRVALLPTVAPLDTTFRESLALAITASDASRRAFDEGALQEARTQIAATLASSGYLARAQGAVVKNLRAQALAIDLALIDSAATALASNPKAKDLAELAKCVRRADAAAETMVARSIPLPFVSVAPAFATLATFDDHTRQIRTAGRALLLSDAATRADLGERLSFAYFEGTILIAGETAVAVQKANHDQPEEKRLEGMELTGIAMTIQFGGIYAVASQVMRINASLEQAVSTQLPPLAAFAAIWALENPQPSRPSRGATRTMSELESAAISLAGVTSEQSKAITDIATAWRLEDMQASVARLQVEASLMADVGASAATIVASDPNTWNISRGESDGPSKSAAKSAQLSEKRQAQSEARAAAMKRAVTAIEQVLGAELAAQLKPAAPAKSTGR